MHYNLDFDRRRELQHLANSLEFGAPTYESGGGWPSLAPDWSSVTAAVTYSPIDLSTLTDAELAWIADHVACADSGFASLKLRDGVWIYHSLDV